MNRAVAHREGDRKLKNRHIQDLIASRRAVLGGIAGLPLLSLASCATPGASPATVSSTANFAGVAPTNADTITLPEGYRWRTLIAWGDALFDTVAPQADLNALTRAEQEQRFGQNNDMLAVFPAEFAFPPPANPSNMLLCANNEYATPELMYPSPEQLELTPEKFEAILASIGVSVVEVTRGAGGWQVRRNRAPGAGKNRRITPFTPVLFSGPAANHPWIVAASAIVNASEPDRGDSVPGAVRCGTLANCAGGYTPWGTYLTAEENFDYGFFGRDSDLDPVRDDALSLDADSFGYPRGGPAALAPRQFRMSENPHGPALYGWITEIDPYDPTSTPKKRTALGRKKNECATTALAADGRVVVYMGDDQRDEHVYKFVTRGRFDPANRTANMDLLDEGQLYCAEFLDEGRGRWIAITAAAANAAAEAAESPIRFRDDADALVRVRDAARLLGATKMDRPEDIEAVRDASWRGLGPVLIACTNNSNRGFDHPGNPRRDSANPATAQNNLTGHILRIDEADGDCASQSFTWDVFVMGGDAAAQGLTAPTRSGSPAHVSTRFHGSETVTGDRFACPDNMFIDATQRVWIATDGSDGVFSDCNDQIMVAPLNGDGPRVVKRFLVGPVGAEICGPLMAPDERAFFCAIQHPGESDVSGVEFANARRLGARPASSFPDGGEAWPRSAVIVVTREDGGRIGD